MYFDSLQDFLMMGKHAAYVWSAFGISSASIVLIHLFSRWRHRKLQKLLDFYKQQMS